MNDVKVDVKDNFLSETDFLKINKKLCEMRETQTDKVPWFPGYTLYPTNKNLLCDDKDNYQFCHHFVPDLPLLYRYDSKYKSTFLPLIDPLIKKINIKSCVRIKANLNTRTPKIIRHGFHVDDNDAYKFKDYKVSIFYVNSNDGYTEFEDGTRIESVANRLVTFPTYLPHTGTTCTDQPFRVVINFNYF